MAAHPGSFSLKIPFTISLISHGWVSGSGCSVVLRRRKISWHVFGALKHLAGNVNAKKYKAALSDCLHHLMVKHVYPDGRGIFSGGRRLFRPWVIIERKILWITHQGWHCHHLSSLFSILVWQWKQHAPQLRAKHLKIDSLKWVLVLMHWWNL